MCFSPSDQMMAAMPIVLNFDSRGLSGFIIALYLIVVSIEFIASLTQGKTIKMSKTMNKQRY